MALLTQKAILSTFEEMLEEMPFDKITVSAFVLRCAETGEKSAGCSLYGEDRQPLPH